MKIEHIAFNVEDSVSSAKWYVENLGLTIVRGADESPYIHFLADDSGKSMLEFYSNPAAIVPDYNAMNPLILHIAFVVDDIEGAREKLLAGGATAVGEITSAPNGDKLAMLRDPWGLAVQLVSRIEPMM
ncbi:MAG: VOC family protein [Anaerolineae bacterium]|nr:VOC family protein [Anaerolineae bacterium]